MEDIGWFCDVWEVFDFLFVFVVFYDVVMGLVEEIVFFMFFVEWCKYDLGVFVKV